MQHLLNLLAAVALLVWGTYLVRTGILRVLGERLRRVLAAGTGNRFAAAASGIGVTALVQSSTATGLITSSFVSNGSMALAAALAVMLGADVGTALMAVALSFDLSWVSPLLILLGVVLYLWRPGRHTGRVGRILIGLGLIIMALQLIVVATKPLVDSATVRAMLGSLSSDPLLEITVGAALAVLAYSSLAIVLLTATLAASGAVPIDVALGLVLGANLGSGALALITTSHYSLDARRVLIGNFIFKLVGCALALGALGWLLAGPVKEVVRLLGPGSSVVLLHLGFNLCVALLFLPLVGSVERLLMRVFAFKPLAADALEKRPRHLDPVALATPSLAIACAAREAMHQADLVETMLRGLISVIRDGDLGLSERLRAMDDTVDELYRAIKYYMTKISRESLDERESRRWTDIVSFTINLEQIGDIVERVLIDIEDKKIKPQRSFSDAGMAEITELHARLVDNLRLGTGVFLNGGVRDAKKLLEEKARFRDLERAYAGTHLERLSDNTAQSIATSSLHLDLISDLKRINSHICSIAYSVLDSAGEAAPTGASTAASAEAKRAAKAADTRF